MDRVALEPYIFTLVVASVGDVNDLSRIIAFGTNFGPFYSRSTSFRQDSGVDIGPI